MNVKKEQNKIAADKIEKQKKRGMKGQTPGEQSLKAAKVEAANAKSFGSASECYETRKLAISMKLRTIAAQLTSHEGQFKDPAKGDSKDWGYAGDLGEVDRNLGEIMSFLAFEGHGEGEL